MISDKSQRFVLIMKSCDMREMYPVSIGKSCCRKFNFAGFKQCIAPHHVLWGLVVKSHGDL